MLNFIKKKNQRISKKSILKHCAVILCRQQVLLLLLTSNIFKSSILLKTSRIGLSNPITTKVLLFGSNAKMNLFTVFAQILTLKTLLLSELLILFYFWKGSLWFMNRRFKNAAIKIREKRGKKIRMTKKS